jgi:hypothetical protein
MREGADNCQRTSADRNVGDEWLWTLARGMNMFEEGGKNRVQ